MCRGVLWLDDDRMCVLPCQIEAFGRGAHLPLAAFALADAIARARGGRFSCVMACFGWTTTGSACCAARLMRLDAAPTCLWPLPLLLTGLRCVVRAGWWFLHQRRKRDAHKQRSEWQPCRRTSCDFTPRVPCGAHLLLAASALLLTGLRVHVVVDSRVPRRALVGRRQMVRAALPD